MSIRRARSRITAVAILCAGSLLVAGCGESGPGPATGPSAPASADPGPASQGELEEQADLGGVQPGSTVTGAELLESAVANADELIDDLGGDWTFLDGEQAYDPELVRSSSNPQTCTTRESGGGLVRGGQYHVVALTEVPDESPEETLERFESSLMAVGYEPLDGNSVTGNGSVVANGQSDEGRVTLTRKPEDIRFQLRTACSTDQSMD